MSGYDPNLFQTQADQTANSFANPISPAMLNPGWGINPALMTPSYMASFRPQYTGTNPYTAYSRPSWAGGVNQLVNPMAAGDPRWGNPVDNNSAAVEAAGTKPMDTAAWLTQRVAIPAIMVGGAARFLGPNASTITGDILGTFAGRGVGGAVGRGIGAGLGRSFGGALFGSAGASAAGGVMGAAGGFLGAAMLPLAVGVGASHLADEGLVQPYIQTRKNARNLMGSFSGVSFGDAQGNSISGRGLGAAEAHSMASRMTRSGIQDMTFSSSEYTEMGGMGMRSGLFDDVSSRKIVDRVKSVADQVKLIMSISRNPSVQAAIEELSKLHIAGANITGGASSQAATMYRQMGMAASVAGTSVQHIMDRVGSQGQLMYQMNGMTPYLGMVAAANSYAGFSNAQRMGVIGNAAMARMGGLEGATQSSMGGMIAGAKTPYNQMGLMNKYMFGNSGSSVPGGRQSVTSTLSSFGQNVSSDLITAQGALTLYGDQLAGKALSEDGVGGVIDQAASILRERGISPRGKGGMFSPEQMAVGLRSMGLDQSQVQAVLFQAASQGSPDGRAGTIKAVNAQTAEQMRQIINQDGTNGGLIGMYQSAKKGVLSFAAGAARASRPLSNAAGSAQDMVGRLSDSINYGKAIGRLSDSDMNSAGLLSRDMDMKGMGLSRSGGYIESDVGGFSGKGAFYEFGAGRTLHDILSKAGNIGDPNFANYRKLAKLGGDMKNPEAKKALYDLIKNSGHEDTERLLGQIEENPDQFLNSAAGAMKGSFSGKKLRATDGSQDLNYDSLMNLKQATSYLKDLDAAGGSVLMEGDISKKYPQLAAMAGKMGKSVTQLATEMGAGGAEKGWVGAATQLHSVEDYMNNPSLLPESDRAEFMSTKDMSVKKQIAVRAAAAANGGAVDPSLKNAKSLSRKDLTKQLLVQMEGSVAKAKGTAATAFDGEALLKMSSTFDGSVSTFAAAVQYFAKSVGAPSSPAPAGQDSGTSFLGGLFGNSKKTSAATVK